MNLENIKSDFFIDDYFNTQVKELGLEFSEAVVENGIPKDALLTFEEAFLWFMKAQDFLRKHQSGQTITLFDTLNFLQAVGHGPTLEATFNPGISLDFTEHPLPEAIVFDGPRYFSDYSYG